MKRLIFTCFIPIFSGSLLFILSPFRGLLQPYLWLCVLSMLSSIALLYWINFTFRREVKDAAKFEGNPVVRWFEQRYGFKFYCLFIAIPITIAFTAFLLITSVPAELPLALTSFFLLIALNDYLALNRHKREAKERRT